MMSLAGTSDRLSYKATTNISFDLRVSGSFSFWKAIDAFSSMNFKRTRDRNNNKEHMMFHCSLDKGQNPCCGQSRTAIPGAPREGAGAGAVRRLAGEAHSVSAAARAAAAPATFPRVEIRSSPPRPAVPPESDECPPMSAEASFEECEPAPSVNGAEPPRKLSCRHILESSAECSIRWSFLLSLTGSQIILVQNSILEAPGKSYL